MTSSWYETTLPTILSYYKLEDMFNDNDFGLFYQYLPDKIYSLERKKCFGGKKSKLKVIRMTAAIAIREKLPLFIIGKLKNPRFFKMLNICPTNISQKGRVGWTVKSSTTGSVNLIRNSTWIEKNCSYHWQLSSASVCFQLDKHSICFLSPKQYASSSVNEPTCH